MLSGPSVLTILSDTDTSGDEVQPNQPSESEMRGQESVADKMRSSCPLGYFQTQSEFNNFHDEMDNKKKSQLEEMKARIKVLKYFSTRHTQKFYTFFFYFRKCASPKLKKPDRRSGWVLTVSLLS